MPSVRSTQLPEGEDPFLYGFLPGQSKRMVDLRREIEALNSPMSRKLARVILVSGETGSGKGRVAKAIQGHLEYLTLGQSAEFMGEPQLDPSRFDQRSVLLPGLGDELFISQLCGFKKGTFTGAVNDSKGLLREQVTGSILLDEIGDLRLPSQTSLLEILDDLRFRPLGGSIHEVHPVQCRLIAATNKPLSKMVEAGQFREDLLFRLKRVEIKVPPLRERREDIPMLVEKELEELRTIVLDENNGVDVRMDPGVFRVSGEDLDWAMGCRWPGNVRELQGAVRKLCILRQSRPETNLEDCVDKVTSNPTDQGNGGLEEIVRKRLIQDLDSGSNAGGSINDYRRAFDSQLRLALVKVLDSLAPEERTRLIPKTARQALHNYRHWGDMPSGGSE